MLKQRSYYKCWEPQCSSLSRSYNSWNWRLFSFGGCTVWVSCCSCYKAPLLCSPSILAFLQFLSILTRLHHACCKLLCYSVIQDSEKVKQIIKREISGSLWIYSPGILNLNIYVYSKINVMNSIMF